MSAVIWAKINELEGRLASLETGNRDVLQNAIYTDPAKWTVNSTKGVADNGVVDLSAAFGVPPKVAAVDVRVDMHHTSVSLMGLGPSAGSYDFAAYTDPGGHDEWVINYGRVRCDSNGDFYVTLNATHYVIIYIIKYYA